MTSTDQKTTTAPKRRWLKKLGIIAGAPVVLLVIAWFVVTSDAFFKGSILPRIGKAMNATLTADSASISPFSQVTLRGVKLQTTGAEPLLTVTELRTRYSLTAMLGGTIKVDEVLIDSPVVTVVENADGTRNTDALSQGVKAEAKETKPAPTATSKPPQVDLKNFNLKNATVRYIRNYAGGTRDVIECTGINITLDDVKNGAAGKLAFALDAKADLNPPDAAPRGTLAAKHDGRYAFTLGPDLMPTQISGSDKVDITQATGALKELAGSGLDFTAEMTPSEIKGVVVSFRKSGTALGELRVSGPFDAVKREGKLTLTVAGIDRKLLNLAGAIAGLDFGSTLVNSTNLIEITKGGAMVAVSGRLGIAAMQVTRAGQTTPTLELATDYALTVDTGKSSATLRTLNLDGQQNGRALLKSELSAPMTFAWGNAASAVGDAALTLTLADLNLGDWKPFLGDSVAGGTINAKLALLSQEAGKKLGVELTSAIANLTTAPGAKILSAKMNLSTTIKQQGDALTVSGKLTIPELTSRNGTNELRLPVTSADFDLTKTGEVIEIRQCLAKLVATARAKNELSLAGRVDMTKPEAITGSLKLTADALDLTAYYDLFTGTTVSSPTKPAKPAPAADASKEPDAMTLPFRNFTFEATLARIYLREIDIANLQANAMLDGGNVSVKPLQFSLNGTPVKASLDLNLGVTGFQYEFTFDAPKVPLAPLVNSYQPERKGQVGGTATASAQLKGAGVTGGSLQKNLTGQFDLVATNLNLSLGNVRTPVIKSIINVIVAIPGAIRNPGAAVGNLLGSLLGAKPSGNGWVDELMKSPVNAIVAHGTAGNGKIELKESFVESAAFRGGATGAIDIATVLTNSVMHFPVTVALSKGLSDPIGLTPANTPTNAVYVLLPDFVKMRGTLGLPKPDVNYLVLAQLALQSGSGILGNTGGAATDQVGGALGAIGGLLGGKQSTTNSTNLAPTNAAPADDLIRGLGGLLGGKKKTVPTNSPGAPTKP